MSRAPPKRRDASDLIQIDPDDDEVDPVTVIIFDDPDSRIVVDGGDGDTWEFVINDEIAYSRWEIRELPEWVEPVLSRIGIRAVRSGEVET